MKKKLKCYMCKVYLKHDSNFGYCKKYNCQATANDDCEIIRAIAPEKNFFKGDKK